MSRIDQNSEHGTRGWSWRPDVVLATGLGLGLSPFAPGTVGTLLGIPIALACKQLPTVWWELGVAVALCAVAIPICGSAEKFLGKKDDRRIVADEYLTFPLCVVGLPVSIWVFVLAFLTHRFFDIIKPQPAAAMQNLRGGWGVVLDDVFASLYALLVNHAIFWLVIKSGLLS